MCKSCYYALRTVDQLDEYALEDRPDDRQRLLGRTQVDAATGCWLWTGSNYPNGYGQFWYNGRSVGAHRAAYDLLVAPLLAGEVVRHHCDVRPCVNPSHLRTGMQADNIADRDQRSRTAVGERHGRATLTVDQVRQLRVDYDRHGFTYRELATRYGVSKSTVANIINRRTWAHL